MILTLFRITLMLGCMLGVLTACLMVTMAGCLVCPWCPVYRRRRVIKHKSKCDTCQYITNTCTIDATWNRLSHADSGGGMSGGGGSVSQSLPSLYHCSISSPKMMSRDTVLHSPTLPHSLSDHIGELRKVLILLEWINQKLGFNQILIILFLLYN